MWFSKTGSYLPRNIWNFFMFLLLGLAMKAGRGCFGKWSPVSCLQAFFVLQTVCFFPAFSWWIFRLGEDTVLPGNHTQHELTAAYVVFLSRRPKTCKCDRICLNHPGGLWFSKRQGFLQNAGCMIWTTVWNGEKNPQKPTNKENPCQAKQLLWFLMGVPVVQANPQCWLRNNNQVLQILLAC